MNFCEIINDDCLTALRRLEERSIQCCITSPPYYGLRDYGHSGQIGNENSLDEYIANLVSVGREIRRVLKDDGTFWLNLGDSYFNYRPGLGQKLVKQTLSVTDQDLPQNCSRRGVWQEGFKEKDRMMIPARVAIALHADGWFLRDEIVWNKPNPMPESVKDRCTKAHEFIFLLTKSKDYFYDQEAIKEEGGDGSDRWGGKRMKLDTAKCFGGNDNGQNRPMRSFEYNGSRHKRSVWTVSTSPYPHAHFATYPTALIKPCILAGSRLHDTILDPFAGSGTTGAAALELRRRAILIELNPAYIPLIERRCSITLSLPWS